MITARLTQFSSSRTFPGQACRFMARNASGSKRQAGLVALGGETLQKRLGEQTNVVFPFAQRGQDDLNDRQPVK